MFYFKFNFFFGLLLLLFFFNFTFIFLLCYDNNAMITMGHHTGYSFFGARKLGCNLPGTFKSSKNKKKYTNKQTWPPRLGQNHFFICLVDCFTPLGRLPTLSSNFIVCFRTFCCDVTKI